MESGRAMTSALTSKIYDVADIHAAQELYHCNGWTDGLPIVPPTEKPCTPASTGR